MTIAHTTTSTTATAIRPIAIVYECPDKPGKPARVTVHRLNEYNLFFGYTCECKTYTMSGECQHTEAVKAERAKQGRA